MEKICCNCRLYDPDNGVCTVVVTHQGEHYELPVLPHDYCHWDRVDKEIQNDLKVEIQRHKEQYFKAKLLSEVDASIEVKQIRMWSDGKNGFVETSGD